MLVYQKVSQVHRLGFATVFEKFFLDIAHVLGISALKYVLWDHIQCSCCSNQLLWSSIPKMGYRVYTHHWWRFVSGKYRGIHICLDM